MLPQLQGKIAGCVAFLLLILQQHDLHYVSTLNDSLCVIGAFLAVVFVYVMHKYLCGMEATTTF